MHVSEEMLRLYAVTDRSWLGQRTLAWQVEEAILGGATLIQLREKHMPRDEIYALGLEIKAVTDKYGIPLIVNDDAGLAAQLGAGGVHIGQEDGGVRAARLQLGEDRIVGATAHNVKEAVEAEQEGADYLGVGAAFGSATKTDARPITAEEIRKICQAVRIPVVAIGGITQENIARLSGTGIAGVAVVSAVFAAADIREAARRLRQQAEQL